LAGILPLLNGNKRDATTRVVLLTGRAGMGKSAMARTIVEYFNDQIRLGWSFLYDSFDAVKDHVLVSNFDSALESKYEINMGGIGVEFWKVDYH
jgi:chloramphenicol 3-O-phosphotransferase